MSRIKYHFSRLAKKINRFSMYRKSLRFYSHFLHPGDLCFDVGAFQGDRTQMFLKLGARVIAIEPQEKNIEYLRQRFSQNDSFRLVGKGLAEREGNLPFFLNEESGSISTFSDQWKKGRFSNCRWNKGQLVPTTTLNKLIEEFGPPDFCKIDVEGFELQVLKGLSRPLPLISFEFTKEFFDDAKSCIDHLLTLGRMEFNCALGESMRLLFPAWHSPAELFQVLSSIDSELLWGDIYARLR